MTDKDRLEEIKGNIGSLLDADIFWLIREGDRLRELEGEVKHWMAKYARASNKITSITKDLEAWKEQAHFEAIKAVERITLLKQQLEESEKEVEDTEAELASLREFTADIVRDYKAIGGTLK